MVASCAAPLEIAVARCSEPCGVISGKRAAEVGLSNAPAVPSTKDAMKICVTVSEPEYAPQASNRAVSASANWQSCMTRLRS